MADKHIVEKLDHKTRETLNGIKGNLDLVLDVYNDPLTTRQKESLEIARQQVDDLFEIIKEAEKGIVEVENLKVLKAAAVTFGHEVNNPLNTIVLAANILKNSCDCPDLNDKWDLCFDNINQIKNLIDKFSSVTRVKTKKYINKLEMIDLGNTQ